MQSGFIYRIVTPAPITISSDSLHDKMVCRILSHNPCSAPPALLSMGICSAARWQYYGTRPGHTCDLRFCGNTTCTHPVHRTSTCLLNQLLRTPAVTPPEFRNFQTMITHLQRATTRSCPNCVPAAPVVHRGPDTPLNRSFPHSRHPDHKLRVQHDAQSNNPSCAGTCARSLRQGFRINS